MDCVLDWLFSCKVNVCFPAVSSMLRYDDVGNIEMLGNIVIDHDDVCR